MKTLGLGNPILGDDGVGWRVAEETQKTLPMPKDGPAAGVDVHSGGGLNLMEHRAG